MLDKLTVNKKIGLSLKEVYRNFYELDNEHIPIEIREQQSDGDLWLLFSDNTMLKFQANTELFSLNCKIVEFKPSDETMNLTNNAFWLDRKQKVIEQISYAYRSHTVNPVSITFLLEDGLRFKIQYVSENEYIFDALIISA